MTAQTLRVGVVGAGANTAKYHIPNLQQQPGVEIVTVANRSVESGRRAAERFGIEGVAGHWQEVIQDDGVDAVCIGTWPYLHAAVTIAALEAGKHVLCEARMAMNAVEARAMLDASRRRPDRVAQIVPAPHTLALDQTIVDLVADGYLGELVAVNARIPNGSAFPDIDAPLHWRHDRTLSGNNIMSMGIWYEALMRWVGPAASVRAMGQVVVTHRRDEAGRRRAIGIPDHVDVLCRLEQGGQMSLQVSTVTGLGPGPEVYLHGTAGTLRVGPGDVGGSGLGLFGARRGDAALAPLEVPAEKIGGWRVEEEFVNAVRGVEPVTHTDFATGVRYMEWTDAVTRSMHSGAEVTLPLG